MSLLLEKDLAQLKWVHSDTKTRNPAVGTLLKAPMHGNGVRVADWSSQGINLKLSVR